VSVALALSFNWNVSKLDDKKKAFIVDFHVRKKSAGIAVYLF